jgi:glycosyltransferase involved in cell wall biosynthesis
VPDRDPEQFAAHVRHLLDHPDRAAAMGARGAARAQRYRWSLAAARLRRTYADVSARSLVACR